MITAHKDLTIIEGHSIDVVQEYTAITQTLLQKTPELVLSMFVALSDEIDKATSNADDAKLLAYVDVVNTFLKMNKDGGEFLHE